MKIADLPPIIDALDRFLEATRVIAKWRLLRDPYREVQPQIRAAFLAQGEALLRRADVRAREAARALPPYAGLWGPVREAALSQGGWLEEWDQVATQTADLLFQPIQAAAAAGMEAGAAEIARRLEIDTGFDLTNPRAVEYLDEHGAEWVSGINDTTRERIRTIVRDGAAEGASYQEIAKRIEDLFAEFAGPAQSVLQVLMGDKPTQSRAERVAITELGMAYERGNLIVVQDLAAAGLEMEKKWLTVHDDRVDPDICAANEAQGWIPVAEAFQSGHMTPLGHPICRCTTLYRRKPRR